MKTKLLIILLVFLQNPLFAKIPDWVKNYGECARFPTQLFVTGFGSAVLNKELDESSCFEAAKKHAARALAEKIFVNIKSTITSFTEENNQQFSQYFNVATETSSNLTISGLDYLQYNDKKHKTYYAFAYASRENLKEFYQFEEEKLLASIEHQFKAGLNFENNNNFNEALKAYFKCQVLFVDLAQIQKIQIGVNSPLDLSILELSDKSQQTISRISKINGAIQKIINRPIKSLDDAAWLLSHSFKKQVSQKNVMVSIQPFSYQETNICSQFSDYFNNILMNEIIRTNEWQINDSLIHTRQSFLPRTMRGNSLSKKTENEFILKGSYWEQGDSLKLFSNLYKKKENKIIASANVFIPQKFITQTNLEIKPENFEMAYKDFKNFNTDEIIGDGLSLDVWTNKGSENLIFRQGETMKVFVQVNMPCYIRFIYHQADSLRVLLYDTLYIDISKVNKKYKIPEEFECATPYGAEVLQICVQNKQFDHLETIYQDERNYLKADLNKIISITRGMKPKKPQEILFAEKRLTITTLQK